MCTLTYIWGGFFPAPDARRLAIANAFGGLVLVYTSASSRRLCGFDTCTRGAHLSRSEAPLRGRFLFVLNAHTDFFLAVTIQKNLMSFFFKPSKFSIMSRCACMLYSQAVGSARRDKGKGRSTGLTEEQKQEIRCAPGPPDGRHARRPHPHGERGFSKYVAFEKLSCPAKRMTMLMSRDAVGAGV